MSYPATLQGFLTSAAVQSANGDAELDHMRRHEQALISRPHRYVHWLNGIAVQRLCEASRRDFRTLISAVGDLPAYMAAEAMQIGLADLAMLDDMRSVGLVAGEDLALLRADLPAAVTDVVTRLLRNIVVRLSPVRRSLPAVRRLADVVEMNSAPRLPIDVGRPVLVVATAGRGTRLRTTIPKALVPVADMPMGMSVVAAARQAGIDQFVFVLRYRAEAHAATFGPAGALLRHPGSSEGTAHTAAFALASLRDHRAPVLLCFSDLPHLPAAAFERALAALDGGTAFVLSTFQTRDADDVGRVYRDTTGRVVAVGQLRLGAAPTAEGDGGLYAMPRDPALAAFGEVCDDNVRREFGLPDVVEVLVRQGLEVATAHGPWEDFVSVNTPAQLSRARLTALAEELRPAFAARFGHSVTSYLEAADAQVGALFGVDDPWPEGDVAVRVEEPRW